MTKVVNPLPLFLDGRGALLDAGFIYVGAPNTNPETPANRYQLYWDNALTVQAAQPLRTLGGVIVNGQNPSMAFLTQANYSMTIKDADGVLVEYIASAADVGGVAPSYQPLDADLTAIAALATTAYGRGLLTLANQAALKSATGIPDPLPAIGGSVSGNITRTGAGSHLYHSAAGLTSGRVFLTAAGAADPTSQPGDIWLTY
ncbi:MAG: hypothetical protein DMF06_04950 [Verrucomicrobia bacterium]|nr:MAG: hypothetical protein DMF06_04950 [Verrucomicrobiota bacterium]